MKTTNYMSYSWKRKMRIHGLMKLALLLLFLTSMAFSVSAQEYFYYYKGEKQYLELNTEYLYLVTSEVDESRFGSSLDKQLELSQFHARKSSKSLKNVGAVRDEKVERWAEVRVPKASSKAYQLQIDQLKNKGNVDLINPYFKSKDSEKLGLSHYFYVKLKKQGDESKLMQMAKDSNVEIVGQNKFMPLWYTLKCTGETKFNALDIANLYQESGFFQYAEPDFLLEDISHTANDPFYPNQWGLNNTGLYGGTAGVDINAVDAWELTTGSRDVVVAVLDHGFEMNHPDLVGNTFGNGYDTGSGTTPAQVLGSHGTACAGIIGARQDNNTGVSGVAPNSKLMSISNPLFLTGTVKQELADGINWAWQNGADIISNSWGHNSLASALIDDAITDALNLGRGGLGTIVVFSAGNGNGAVAYPANSNPDIISVGAMSPCGERKSLASCDGEGWGSDFGTDLDVVAPGVLISTTDRQGGTGYNPNSTIHPNLGGTQVASDYANQDYTVWFNGTSAACPMVAGVASLILSVNPCLDHYQVEDIIEQTAQKVGGYAYAVTGGRPNGTWDDEMGYGLVDAEAAVLQAQSLLPSAPAFDIFAKDRPYDTGIEANPDGGPMWLSRDIWVRKSLDGGAMHENPEFKQFSPNGIYVKITNRGSNVSDCANLSVYFAKAGTGLVWPQHWDNFVQSGVEYGDKINTVSIPAINPGASITIEIPWYPPNPADFTTDIHHFCLLARIESPADPMFNEQLNVNVGQNVRNNNNIVWRNISVYDNVADLVSVFVRPTISGWNKLRLRFWDRGFKEEFRKPFFERGGRAYVKIDDKLMSRIKEAQLNGVKVVDENLLLFTSARASIDNLLVHSKETFPMQFAFDVDLGSREEVILDFLQENSQAKGIEGGERFLIKGSSKGFGEFKLETSKTESLVFPNPATDQIFVKQNVDFDGEIVEVTVQNTLETKLPVSLYKGKQLKGEFKRTLDVSHLKKGIYILKIKVGERIHTERLVVK